MKHYPSITNVYAEDTPWNEHCIAFDKLDGSNLRFEWNKKRGWYKFGTRNRMFDRTDPDFGIAVDLFLNKYGESLAKVMTDKFPKIESTVAYAEFLGPYSFCGLHDSTHMYHLGHLKEPTPNDPKDVILFDFNLYKKGFLSAPDFVKHLGHLHIPKVIYEGRLTESFVEDVRSGVYPVIEGVIIKGGEGHNSWMKKVKTTAYLQEIKRIFKAGWQNYWE